MSILALYHFKGGVGKTAAAVNLAYLAAQSGASTLLCDLDPQSSATFYYRIAPKLSFRLKHFVKGGKYVSRHIKGSDYAHLDLLPATLSHRHLARALTNVKGSRQGLRRMLEPLKSDYTYIILDCPPSLTRVADNILTVADCILVPVIPSTLAVRAYEQLVSFCHQKRYDIHKIVAFFSMVESRKKLHRQIMDQMRTQCTGLLSSTIPYLADIEHMGVARAPVTASAPTTRAARSYQQLWRELQEVLSQA
ncbi:Sporulation initiation inhibitor protein Soj [Candidatus Entotheonellaceae bacterium PAL068K]